ncbi:acyl-CoA reductase, partial [Aquimarina celericrescens]|nr:acyl-CoA reductase [Aquimarina celericrescens]
LIAIQPKFKSKIEFTKDRLPQFGSVIATGSNNTARYFEYYFKNKPHIIRKNGNSAVVINGTESKEELEKLGDDIFKYFGLGCRNVSKLFVPEGYDFDSFFKAM